VLQDNELLLLAAEHRVQPEVAADFCAAAHPKWAERAADAPEDEVHYLRFSRLSTRRARHEFSFRVSQYMQISPSIKTH
jgi:hypothetical protein